MQSTKSLKLGILALLFVAFTIFSGCAGTAPFINHAPTIISAEITATFVETAYTYDVDAIDPDAGDILTYSLSVNPAGMDIDPTTGVINWTPTAVGNFEVTVEVSDGSESATQSFTITVNKALLISIGVLPSSMTLEIGESRTIDSVTAHYSDDTETIITPLKSCTYVSNKPSVATVNSDGVITGIFLCTASTPVTVTVTYTKDSITQTNTISVIVTNPSPG